MTLKRNNLLLRSLIIRALRDFFDSRGFLEVETPHLIPANAPEEYIDPKTSGELFLHTSPEICMKRLLCRGYEKIYQICRCWRQDERGSRHIPEFTMLEWYRAHSDYRDLMEDCKDLLKHVGNSVGRDGQNRLTYNGHEVDLGNGFVELTVHDAFTKFSPISMEIAVENGSFDEIMANLIEPQLDPGKPVILSDYPIEMAALARPKPENQKLAERFELYAGGMELANGFSELNNAEEQKRRFELANIVRQTSGLSPLPIPENFLRELPSMPVSAGIALGVDRLVMLFTGALTIDEVVTFTPEQL